MKSARQPGNLQKTSNTIAGESLETKEIRKIAIIPKIVIDLDPAVVRNTCMDLSTVTSRRFSCLDLPISNRLTSYSTEGVAVGVTSVSIVIPVYRGGVAFEHCLESLEQYLPPGTEVVIVIDGQDNGSAQIAQSFKVNSQLHFHCIELPKNCGPAYARNVGAKMAKGDLIFFVDADVALNARTLPSVLQVFEQHPEIAALIGSYDDAPGSRNFLSQYKNLLHHYTHQIARTEASTFWGACGVIRRDVFLAMGGFDPAYRDPCIEDIELGYRLRRSGYRIRLCCDVQVKHLKRWGTRSLLKADFFYRAIPWTELIWRDRNFVSDLNLDTSSRLSVVSIYGILFGFLGCALWGDSIGAQAILLVLLCSGTLLSLNASVYRFFHHKRGFWFALRTIPWHWLYYAYSGLAFIIGTVRYWWSRQAEIGKARKNIADRSVQVSQSQSLQAIPYDLLPTQSKR